MASVGSVVLDVLGVLALVIAAVLFIITWRWRREYARRVAELEARMQGKSSAFAAINKMVRNKNKESVLNHQNSMLVKMSGALDLREEYRNREGGGGVPPPGKPAIGLCSISDYLTQLHPERETTVNGQQELVDEVDTLLTQAVLGGLGPATGSVLLPLLGEVNVAKMVVNMAVSRGWIKNVEEASVGTVIQQFTANIWESVTEMSLAGISFGADSYMTYKQVSARSQSAARVSLARVAEAAGSDSKKTPLLDDNDIETGIELPQVQWKPPTKDEASASSAVSLMRWGEAKAVTFPENTFSSPFVMERSFEQAVAVLLKFDKVAVEKTGASYDPDEYPVDVPTPINPSLLPGLHKGFGGAVKTQTFREIQTARALNVVLNRLASNDTLNQGDPKFVVGINGKEVTRPEGLIQGLMDTGHTISLRPRYNTVSFGFGLCLKEDDGTWTNIPWALVFRTGYEDMKGRSSYCALNHGGICIFVEGPIVKKACSQHHNAMDGLCGWYTNETCNVPWLAEKVELGDGPIQGEQVVRAARLLGLYATVLNAVATRMDLPFGGYGTLGVCLDSSAVIEKALFGIASSYPMLHVGRFHMHSIREARSFLAMLESVGDDRSTDMKAIVDAMESLPTDTGATPALAADTARRVIACTPKALPFKIMEKSVDVCNAILAENKA